MTLLFTVSATGLQAAQIPKEAQAQYKNFGHQSYSPTLYEQKPLLNLSQKFSHETKTSANVHQSTLKQQVSKAENTILNLKTAIESYRENNLKEKEANASIALARIYNHQGQSFLSISLLRQTLQLAAEIKNQNIEQEAYEVLGNTYMSQGNYGKAIRAYRQSVKLLGVQQLEVSSNLSSINSQQIHQSIAVLNNLVLALEARQKQYQLQAEAARQEKNTADARQQLRQAEKDQNTALEVAEKALKLSINTQNSSTIYALLNWARLSPQGLTGKQKQFGSHTLKALPDSRTKVYLLINWAEIDPSNASFLFSQAVEIAQKIGDRRAESFALGELGNFYEQKKNWDMALQFSQSAQIAAQAEFAYDSLYRWQWQTGRIYRKIGKPEKAIEVYREAVNSLQTIQEDLIAASQQLQYDFRSEVEPIYREMLEISLSGVSSQTKLEEALEIFDLLRLAQLQNYFGDDCFEIRPQNNSPQTILSQTNAASIHSVILPDKTYIILQLPDGKLKKYEVAIPRQKLTEMVLNWRSLLTFGGDFRYLSLSQSLYNLIFRPLEQDLAAAAPSTLVFIHDEVLQNVPMAALYDGQQFLVEKYALATSLGLGFIVNSNSPDSEERISGVAAFGLSIPVGDWSGLGKVEQEIESVENIVGGQEFLNQEFTVENFEKQVEQGYSIIHLATHGFFGGIAERSFIHAYDAPISIPKIELILSESELPIELLVLSACETAAGNSRSVLGLAGVATRAGVETTLGSLWKIPDDAQFELIRAFYHNLSDLKMSKAKALQKAQSQQIERLGTHPWEWAGLSLIGDWQ